MIKILIISLFISNAFAKTEETLIPLEIKKRSSENIEASIGELTEEGKELGIDSLTLEGRQSVEQIEGNRNRIKIIWQKAKLNESEQELSEPLVSEVEIEGNIREGDQFSAKGNAHNLVRVFDELKDKLFGINDDDGEDDLRVQEGDVLEENLENYISNSGGSSTYGSVDDTDTGVDPFAISYEVTEDDEVITSDGCSKRVDLDNMVIYVQKRTLKGDEEIKPCSDSEEYYQLIRDYKGCGEDVRLEEEKVFSKYRVVYNHPIDDAVIQVESCTVDKQKFVELSRDYESCGLKHDTAKDKSFARYRLVYDFDGSPRIFQDCIEDENIAFQHIQENKTCKPQITDTEVIFSERKAIKKDGQIIYLSECEPLEDTYEIYEEVCNEQKYTHDFRGGQSFLNKNYFYIRNDKRVDVSKCIKSDVVLTHKFDVSACEVVHDDQRRQSQLYAKAYVEDASVEGGKDYITDCKKSGNAISYINEGQKWLTISSHNENITSIKSGQKLLSISVYLEGIGFLDREWLIHIMRIMSGHIDRYWANRFGKKLCDPKDYDVSNVPISRNAPNNKEIENYKSNIIGQQWVSSSGRIIDKSWSDQTPQLSVNLSEERCMICKEWRCYYSANNYLVEHNLKVSQAKCMVSVLRSYPMYRRFDSTEFIDKLTILDSKTICGTGTKLRGEG